VVLDDECLLTQLAAQDPDAWEELYRRAYPRLLAFACRRLATREQADDAVSEAMVRAINSIDRYVPGAAGIEGWLFGIVRFVVLEAYRDRSIAQPDIGDGPSAESGPLDRVVHDEEQRWCAPPSTASATRTVNCWNCESCSGSTHRTWGRCSESRPERCAPHSRARSAGCDRTCRRSEDE